MSSSSSSCTTTTATAAAAQSPLTGSCLCGKITYTIAADAEPMANVICYCVNCRKATGTHMFNSSVFPLAAFAVTSAPAHTPKVYVDTKTDSGHALERHFCGDCGSPMYCRSLGPQGAGWVSVTAGTVDRGQRAGTAWAPTMVVYGEERPAWLEGIRIGERKPGSAEGMA